jgi:teichuronic acid biosynthesis glycosyltransferase TuaG
MIKLNKSKKKVSVIMPFFRKKEFFEEAYNSVLNQSYTNIEIIIIYDDHDLEQLNFVKNIIKKKNTIVIVNKRNRGVSYSRNRGIKKSKGYYVAFLDCDDIWHRNKLKEQITFMEKFQLDCTCTNYSVINKNGNILYSLSSPSISTYQNLLKSCDIGLSTVVIKKKFFTQFKFKNLLTKEDYLLWLNITKKGININGIEKTLVYWRDIKGSLSSNFIQRIKDSFKIYYYYEKQFLFQSMISIVMLSLNSFKKKIKRFYL